MQRFIYLTIQNSKVHGKRHYWHYLQNHCLQLMLGIISLVTMSFVHQNGIKEKCGRKPLWPIFCRLTATLNCVFSCCKEGDICLSSTEGVL